MNTYEFKIEEVSRDGYIAWDAIEVKSGDRFPVNASTPLVAGTFPEITEYLKNHNVNFQVTYVDQSKDSWNNKTWEYIRGSNRVLVHDIPRTVFRIGSFR